jgi:SAM-dependent methyltransferase
MTTGGKLSILDVGSEPEGLGTYIRRDTSDVVLLGMRFLSLLAAKTTGQKAVLGSGLSLPFADDAFDVVVSLHVLEHIPASEKELFLREVKRGSNKYVIILTPCEEHAEQLAKRLLAWKPYRNSHLSKMTEEHVRYGVPSPEFPGTHFPSCSLVWQRNATVQLIYFALLSLPVLRWLSGVLFQVFLRWFDGLPPFTECLMSWTKENELDQGTQASAQVCC